MPTEEETRINDAAELQRVLTRYIDSYDGYHQAAEAVDSLWLKAAFLEIAERRKTIIGHVAELIIQQGEKPDTDGSAEGAVHRWWIRLRAQMTDEEFKAVLAECVRGETVLADTIQNVLDHGDLDSHHAEILKEVSTELKAALETFKTAMEH